MDEDRITYDILREHAEYAKEETDGKMLNLIKDLEKHGIKATLQARIKSYESAKEKKIRRGYDSIEQESDFLGYKIITLYSTDIPITAQFVDRRFAIEKTKDYIRNRKPIEEGGYRGTIHKKTHIQCICDEIMVSVPTEIQITSNLRNSFWELDHPSLYKCPNKDPLAYKENEEILMRIDAIEEIFIRRRGLTKDDECRIWPSEPKEAKESEVLSEE